MGIINILCLRLIIVQEYFAELGLWHQAHLTKSVPGGAPLTTVNSLHQGRIWLIAFKGNFRHRTLMRAREAHGNFP